MVINGFNARVISQEKSLYLVPADRMAEGVTITFPSTVRITSKLVADSVEKAGFEVSYVRAFHNRYVKYSLRSVMRERSGEYSHMYRFERDAAGAWVKTETKLRNGIY